MKHSVPRTPLSLSFYSHSHSHSHSLHALSRQSTIGVQPRGISRVSLFPFNPRVISSSNTSASSSIKCNPKGPIPFPSPLNIGVDISSTARFKHIITGTSPPHQPNVSVSVSAQSTSPSTSSSTSVKPRSTDPDSNPDTTLKPQDITFSDPRLSASLRSFIRKVFNAAEWHGVRTRLQAYYIDSEASSAAKRDETHSANVDRLAEFLASRFAAKEAAIKAHTHRRLHYRDIIVLSPMITTMKKKKKSYSSGSGSRAESPAPQLLINPVRPLVRMDQHVARLRGLVSVGGSSRGEYWRYRPLKTDISERWAGRLSLSHDGGYAVAVAQVVDQMGEEEEEGEGEVKEMIIDDDGTKEAFHEPFIGDEGYDIYGWIS